jgi:DNA replication protein DnaC
MLINSTIEKLRGLRLPGMITALEEQMRSPDAVSLAFEDRLGLLVDREETERLNRRYQGRLRKARLREPAMVEDLNYNPGRGMDKSVMLSLATCDWIRQSQHILITGSTGVGKTYAACALGHKACQLGFTVTFHRVGRLLHNLAIAKADGSYGDMMADLTKTDLLILDDWGLAVMGPEERRDFLELVEDRNGARSMIITSQVPPEKWFDVVGEPTLGDAILDRIMHRSHKIALTGPSIRKETSSLTGRSGTK